MNVETLTRTILHKMSGIGKWQTEFLTKNFLLQFQVKGRHNYLNMSRYSEMNEGTFRKNYQEEFDFLTFCQILIDLFAGEEQIVVFDPSYIFKSGKYTPGLGYFWSGCAGQNKRGLEIGGFACVDIEANTAFHLIADQTLAVQEHENFLSYYSALVTLRSKELLKVSSFLAVDAFFSKKPFIDAVLPTGLTIISRFRKDIVLWYPYLGPHPRRRGAKTKYNGKFDARNLDEAYFSCCIKHKEKEQKDCYEIYEATLYSKALKRYVRLVVKHEYNHKGELKTPCILFSTDTSMSGIDIYCYYKARFQIEFLYRDAKQYTGLEHCQSRSETALHFHFNTALTSVSLAKALHHCSIPIEDRGPFSMADIKTQYFNELMADIFIEAFGLCPNDAIIVSIRKKLIQLGKIRA